MLRRSIIGLALAASISGTPAAAATPRFETILDCAAAARLSSMLLNTTNAPRDLQMNYASLQTSVTEILHAEAPAEGMTVEQADLEVARRTSVMVDHLNTLPDEAFRTALFKHISLDPGGGMATCQVLLDETKANAPAAG